MAMSVTVPAHARTTGTGGRFAIFLIQLVVATFR